MDPDLSEAVVALVVEKAIDFAFPNLIDCLAHIVEFNNFVSCILLYHHCDF